MRQVIPISPQTRERDLLPCVCSTMGSHQSSSKPSVFCSSRPESCPEGISYYSRCTFAFVRGCSAHPDNLCRCFLHVLGHRKFATTSHATCLLFAIWTGNVSSSAVGLKRYMCPVDWKEPIGSKAEDGVWCLHKGGRPIYMPFVGFQVSGAVHSARGGTRNTKPGKPPQKLASHPRWTRASRWWRAARR